MHITIYIIILSTAYSTYKVTILTILTIYILKIIKLQCSQYLQFLARLLTICHFTNNVYSADNITHAFRLVEEKKPKDRQLYK